MSSVKEGKIYFAQHLQKHRKSIIGIKYTKGAGIDVFHVILRNSIMDKICWFGAKQLSDVCKSFLYLVLTIFMSLFYPNLFIHVDFNFITTN